MQQPQKYRYCRQMKMYQFTPFIQFINFYFENDYKIGICMSIQCLRLINSNYFLLVTNEFEVSDTEMYKVFLTNNEYNK